MLAGQLEVRLFTELAEIAQNMKDAEQIVEGRMAKIGAAISAGMASGWEKAKEAWVTFKDWTERQIVIWGVALAIGVSAAVLGAVYTAFKAISFAVGLLTGESYKSANIDALAAMNKEVKTLQQNLPLTAVGASALNEALKTQGTSAEDYAAAMNAVSSAVRNNRDELDRLGVKYKDQNGRLLTTTETLANAKGVLDSYTEGWDRNQAAVAIGMGTEKQIQAALSVSAEKIQTAKDRLIAYGLVIGTDTQSQVARYEEAMRAFNRELDLTSQGFKRAIADNIMPLLADFAEFFREGFPTAVMAFRYSMATVMSLFYGLKTVVYMVSESVLGSIHALGLAIGGLANASGKALTGDFSGAKDELIKGWEAAKKRLGDIGDNIVEQARRNAAAMRQAWGADSLFANNDPDARPKGGKPFSTGEKDGIDEGALADVIAEAKAALAREQEIRAIQHAVRKEEDERELKQIGIQNAARASAEQTAAMQSIELREWERSEKDRILWEEFQERRLVAAAEKTAEETKRSMLIGTWQLAAELLQSMAGKSKLAAIASIALSKGIAIAQVIHQTAVASMAAFAPPIGLGPLSGAGLAASIQALGAVQIGLIAATGLMQAAGVASGGAAAGTPSNPVSVTGGGFDVGGPRQQQAAATAQPSQTTIIDTSGLRDDDIFSGKTMRRWLESLEKATKKGGVVVLST